MRRAMQKLFIESVKLGVIPSTTDILAVTAINVKIGNRVLPSIVVPTEVKMTVTVDDVLNLVNVMMRRLPDYFKTLGLTASEMVVMEYLMENLARLKMQMSNPPRDKRDGLPRFWRPKGKMANECCMSDTGFRNTVRHLAELGYVTPMDTTPDDPDNFNQYCIGVKLGFLPKEFLEKVGSMNQREKYNALWELLYTKEHRALAYMNSDDPLAPYINSEKYQQVQRRYQWYIIKRVPVHRKAITGIQRKPIFLTPAVVRAAREEMKRFEWVLSSDERKVMEVKRYYEMKCSISLNTSGFCAMSTKYEGWRKNKKWKWLCKLQKQCETNGWDYRVFIDSQFDRLKWFKSEQKYVFLNQFFSQGAINYYHRYVKNYKQCHSVLSNAAVKTMETKNFIQRVADTVVIDCERIKYFIKTAHKRPRLRDKTDEELKIIYFSNHWMSLSKYYLSHLPWFKDWLKTLPQSKTVTDLINDLDEIQKSPSMARKIKLLVEEAERQMGVPKTMSLVG